MYQTQTISPRSRPAPAAVAILYPRVGNVLRVPLRRTRTGGAFGCEQHPERQFIVWFNRMMAARPGFPRQIKSILLLTGAPLCANCYRALATFLSRYHLAGKLRLRTSAPAACACGGVCGCGSRRPNSVADAQPAVTALLLDQLLTDSELEQEGWWQKVKNVGQAAILAGATLLPAPFPVKPVVDMITAAGEAEKKRRATQQTVDDNTPPPSSRRLTPQRELENPFLANPFSREFEQEGLAQELSLEQKMALRDIIATLVMQLKEPLYKNLTKYGSDGGAVSGQVDKSVGGQLPRIANDLAKYAALVAWAKQHGINEKELAAALKTRGKQLVMQGKGKLHKELAFQ